VNTQTYAFKRSMAAGAHGKLPGGMRQARWRIVQTTMQLFQNPISGDQNQFRRLQASGLGAPHGGSFAGSTHLLHPSLK